MLAACLSSAMPLYVKASDLDVCSCSLRQVIPLFMHWSSLSKCMILIVFYDVLEYLWIVTFSLAKHKLLETLNFRERVHGNCQGNYLLSFVDFLCYERVALYRLSMGGF